MQSAADHGPRDILREMSRWRLVAEPVDVLVVCTANLCRSPIMETLLAAAEPSITVRSAGTSAPEGQSWHPLALTALDEAGYTVSGKARRLRARDVKEAKLVLTAAGMHRARAVQLDPSAEERCFTLLEAARLLQLAPAAAGIGPAGLAEHLGTALRGHPIEHDDDLPDPVNGKIEDFRACLRHVADAVRSLAAALSRPAN
jgi:protein-tyrosine phosphatase